MLCLYGDVIFDDAILGRLLRAQGDVVIAVDRAFYDNVRAGNGALPERPHDLVVTESRRCRATASCRRRRARPSAASDARCRRPTRTASSSGSRCCRSAVRSWCARSTRTRARTRGRFHEAESLSRAAFTDLLQELIDRGHTVTCVDVYKGWMEVDTFEDYRRARGPRSALTRDRRRT